MMTLPKAQAMRWPMKRKLKVRLAPRMAAKYTPRGAAYSPLLTDFGGECSRRWASYHSLEFGRFSENIVGDDGARNVNGSSLTLAKTRCERCIDG